jgi:predicted ArsR family transcriptional regulator
MDTFERIRMMLDDQTSTILKLTSQNPRTASQLCKELQIPRSVCYRKLKTLISEQLLDVSHSQNQLGGKVHATRYVSNIDKAYVSLEHGELMMVLKLKNESHPHMSRISSDSETS